jgi:hypothetical protein
VNKVLTEEEAAAVQAGVRFGLDLLSQIPNGNKVEFEAHVTGVLIAFWGVLWGTFGTDYARGFIEAQLRGMESESKGTVQ